MPTLQYPHSFPRRFSIVQGGLDCDGLPMLTIDSVMWLCDLPVKIDNEAVSFFFSDYG